MKQQRKNTHIIATRAAVFAGFINCNRAQKKAAYTAAANAYNDGSSGANAISQGFKIATIWKATGRPRSNVINFQQHLAQKQVLVKIA